MIAATANLAWFASQSGMARRFRRQLHAPVETQAQVLRGLLRRHAASAFGRQFDFAHIRTAEEFTRRVPLATYDDHAPWIRRIQLGEPSVLTAGRVAHLVPTSGSSGARKLIPFTAGLQRGFDAAIGPWIVDLYATHPRALFGPAYWSISPALGEPEHEASAVPIGFADDSSYLGGLRRRLVAATMAVPGTVRGAHDHDCFTLLTLACLLRRRDLRLISVWHPSFLLLLLDTLPRQWDAVLDVVQTGRLPAGTPPGFPFSPLPARARELRRLDPAHAAEFWPQLAVISCWADAHAAGGAQELAARFPDAVLQPKGLFATEGAVTLPFGDMRPLAVGSHYFEFIDAAGTILPLEALRAGETYEVVMSTGGGLWRYRLGDRVRVEGFADRTPSLAFVGRTGRVVDLRGEKLAEEFVASILPRLGAARFALLAPETDGRHAGYTLYWEGANPPAAEVLDRRLAENPHYAWCRHLGQLRPPRVFQISADGLSTYYRRAAAGGARLGELKPPALARTMEWTGVFAGCWRD